jgi:hypothetical protein
VNVSTLWRLYAGALLALLVLLSAAIAIAVWLVLS